jgi:hypothetical protein
MPREYTHTMRGGQHATDVAPMTLTQPPHIDEASLWRAKSVGVQLLTTGHGVLETYVCAGCGFVEWYCQDPTSIPIGPEYMSDILDYATDTPYR